MSESEISIPFEAVGITERHLAARESDAHRAIAAHLGSVALEPEMVLVLCAAYRAYHRLKLETKT